MKPVLVSGVFEQLQLARGSQSARFLQEAARFGPVHALIWSDELAEKFLGRPPVFPLPERVYFLQAMRSVASWEVVEALDSPEQVPLQAASQAGMWAVLAAEASLQKQAFAGRVGIRLRTIGPEQLSGFPPLAGPALCGSDRKKVVVTGSFDWLHSGHVRFFEEVSEHGELTVIVGHDANIRLLKGEGHPLYTQEERLYLVQSIRYVSQAMLSTGSGWLDAEPELERLRPNIYAVNEDGDKPEKRAYCAAHGMQYLVLKRAPKEGLNPRSSTELRGF